MLFLEMKLKYLAYDIFHCLGLQKTTDTVLSGSLN